MIRIENFGVCFTGPPPLWALENISLTLESHKIHALIGASGCGKTTLLRSLLGSLQSQPNIKVRGSVVLGELTPDRWNLRERAKKIGYVVQEGGLFPHLSIEKNLRVSFDLHASQPEKAPERITELLEMVELSKEMLLRYPNELSGGQRQRVGLMRALMFDPEYLMMDEPLGALDPMVRTQLQERLLEIFKTLNKTVILVTHDLSEAAFLADTITLLKSGQVIQHGPLENFLQSPQDPYTRKFLDAQRRISF